jgi:hypothetical protein
MIVSPRTLAYTGMPSPSAIILQDTIPLSAQIQHVAGDPSMSAAVFGFVVGATLLVAVVVIGIVAHRRLRKLRQPLAPVSAAQAYSPHFDGMSAREAQFYAMAMGARRPTPPGVPRPTPGSSPVVRPAAAERNGGDTHEPDYAGPVHCPACGTKLGSGGPMLQYVTRCPSCTRWVSTRLDGDRITIESRAR